MSGIRFTPEIGRPGEGWLCQLKVTLKWSKPPIWRRVMVRADMTLDRLHDVIQIAMGWTDSHLHQFISGRTFYGKPDPEMSDMLDEKHHKVADVAPAPKKKFVYEYDFGDGWQHDVVVEKVFPPDPTFKHPVCVAGANACPPEDCGGMHGYYDLLEALSDPNHPEHSQMSEWIGGDWDAAAFDADETNDMLKRVTA